MCSCHFRPYSRVDFGFEVQNCCDQLGCKPARRHTWSVKWCVDSYLSGSATSLCLGPVCNNESRDFHLIKSEHFIEKVALLKQLIGRLLLYKVLITTVIYNGNRCVYVCVCWLTLAGSSSHCNLSWAERWPGLSAQAVAVGPPDTPTAPTRAWSTKGNTHTERWHIGFGTTGFCGEMASRGEKQVALALHVLKSF